MPDIKKMEGPVKFKKGVELYFDPKKDMFYDPKKKKYVSEKDILALEEVDLFEKSEEYLKFFQSALKKFGIDSPAELDDEKKKEFFDYVDKNWEGENEEDEEETVEENCGSKHKKMEEDKEFKPHMMYDPKTGKAYKAEKPEDHERMKKLGYTHEKPEKIEELSLERAIAEAKEWKVGAPVFIVISYHTNGKHSTTVIRKKDKAIKFAKDEEYHEDDVKGAVVLDMKVGKFINKDTGEYIKEGKEKDMKELEESRIRLSSLMNGGALLYDRDEDPDDDKLATVKVKGNPKKDIKNGDDLVLSLMGKGKSKEKEILKSLKKYYPKSKVVKEERIQEMFDLGDKVKRKDGSEEGEVVQRKTEDKSVGGRYKLKLKNGSRSKWINGNSLELVEQFSKKMEKYVDACGKDFTNWK